MHSIKRLLAVMGTIVALMAFAPSRRRACTSFHLDKTCGADPSEPSATICTVQHSDFKWIPAGTDVRYLSQSGNVVQASIEIRNGRTDGAVRGAAMSTRSASSAEWTKWLTQFNLEVVVTANADVSLWYWDGTYWFGD